MPADPGRLAEAIAATLRSAQARLAEPRAAPEAKRPLLDRSVETEDAPLHGSGGVTPKEFVGLLRHDVAKAASILQGMFEDDVLALGISMAHAKAQVVLERVADPESPKVKAALQALEVALKAAQLWHAEAWRELAGIVVDLAAVDRELTDMLLDQGPQVPLASLRRAIDEKRQMIDETKPVLEAHLRVVQARQRGSSSSARERRPKQQERLQAFVQAMREDPQGGPTRWAGAVAPKVFGGTEARHAARAARWFYRHRSEIEAALSTDSPKACQPELPDA